MKDYIEESGLILQNILLNTMHGASGGERVWISKSTVHKDVTDRLLKINPGLAQETRKILDTNKSERHIRGGMAPGKNICTGMRRKNVAKENSFLYNKKDCREEIYSQEENTWKEK